jgi:hypothetical protein
MPGVVIQDLSVTDAEMANATKPKIVKAAHRTVAHVPVSRAMQRLVARTDSTVPFVPVTVCLPVIQ